jgi:hypothetical protein
MRSVNNIKQMQMTTDEDAYYVTKLFKHLRKLPKHTNDIHSVTSSVQNNPHKERWFLIKLKKQFFK